MQQIFLGIDALACRLKILPGGYPRSFDGTTNRKSPALTFTKEIMKQILFAALAVACTTALAQPATTITVSPADMKGWVFFDDGTGGPCLPVSVCAMVVGPSTPPAGNGSARLKLVLSTERPTLGALLGPLAGKRFADLTA